MIAASSLSLADAGRPGPGPGRQHHGHPDLEESNSKTSYIDKLETPNFQNNVERAKGLVGLALPGRQSLVNLVFLDS